VVVTLFLPSGLAYTTGVSGGANSASTCRQPPQGAAGRSRPPTIATASILRSPPAIIIATALRSAQTESGYELFSTFPAAKMRPRARIAAPTS
jgi:hypothetical protein